jgi:predicted permease
VSFWRRKKFESDMDVELGFHIDAYIDDLVRSGIDRSEAERRARLEFGALEATKDECRQAWGLQWMDELRADLRLTFRTLRRNPGFAAVAILSLALGIGANTAIFGLMDAVMLRLLPVPDADRLMFVRIAGTDGRDGPPYPYFELLRDRATSYEGIAAFAASNMEIVIDGGREQARGAWVSGNFYQTLGVAPVIGRTLAAYDDQTPGKGGRDGAVAVISRAFWQQRFGGDPAVVGRVVHMMFDTERTVTIVGVMPSEIMLPEPGRPVDIAVPITLADPAMLRDRVSLWMEIVARLKPGVSAEQARIESNTLFQAYMTGVRLPPDVHKRLYDHTELRPAAKGLGGLRTQFSQPLTAMMVLAGLVLLAACVNVANLMLARATARQKEFAVRLAIGAGCGRLIRQTLTEALVLVGSGAALGILLARQGEAALAGFFAEGQYKIVLDLSLNGHVLLFTLTVAVLSGLAFAVLPAVRASRFDPGAGLQIGSRGIAGSRLSMRLGRALVITQVALSTVLLAGAGMFIRTVSRLESVDLGFNPEGILTMEVTSERQAFGAPQWLAAQAEVLDRIRRIPGVRSASWATMSPMSGRDRGAILDIPGFAPRTDRDRVVHLAAISPEYFETLGISLLLGRAFSARDDATAAKVAILNQTAARFYFGSANPIGKTVRFANYPTHDLVYEVVGLVKDARHDSLREQPSRFIYLPIPQSVERIRRLALDVRCAGDAAAFAAPVKRELQAVRPAFPINDISTIARQIQQSLRNERLVMALSAAFGTLALLLACIGLYGVLAYAVTRRTGEIGIRMALGATGSEMIWLILREALALAASGVVIGAPAVWLLGRLARALLFGVGLFDLPAFGFALLVLLVFAAIAGIVPARRAGRLDPMSALRCE